MAVPGTAYDVDAAGWVNSPMEHRAAKGLGEGVWTLRTGLYSFYRGTRSETWGGPNGVWADP